MTAHASTALRRTMPAAWVHLGAMQRELHRRDLRAVGEFLTLRDLAPAHGGPVVCCVNGQYIGRADWWQPVRAGDVVVFAAVAQGGDSDAGRLIATIAVAVASAYTGGAVGAAYGSGWGAVAAVGVSLVGGLLVNRFFPIAAGTFNAAENSPTYSATLQGNQPRLGQAVPVRYGLESFYPDMACPAYSEFVGDDGDMYYCAGLAIGLGQYEVLAVFIEDTPIAHFSDVQVAIVGPGMASRTQATGYTGVETFADQSVIETGMVTAIEVASQDVLDDDWIGPFTATPAGTQVDKLFFDLVFPRGIGTVEDDGSIGSLTIAWQVAWQRIDDSGAPLAPWEQQTASKTAGTSRPVRISTGYDVTDGRYRCRIRRLTARSDNDRTLNDLQWAQVRARLSVAGVARTDVTGLVIRVRSTQQLSALTQRRIRVVTQRLLPVWDGDSWSALQATRNPAWALADLWRNDVYGRGLADARVDLESLLSYATTWDARQDRLDYSFDTQLTTDDAAQLVAAAGRARTMLRRGAVFSLVRDEPQGTAVATFMPRNIDRDSFRLRYIPATSETPDCLAGTYRSGAVWADRLVYAQVHAGAIYVYEANDVGVPQRPVGVPAPALIEDVQLRGVIGKHHAKRQVAYLLARALYRREEGSFAADLDALLMSGGSLIAMGHDLAEWAGSGDVVDWDEDTLTATLSEPPQWVAGGTHYIRLQADTGAPGGAIGVTPGATPYEVVLAEAPAATPSVADPDRERTRYLFGELADVQREVVAAGIRPTDRDTVEVDFFVDDARVHAADAAWLPTGDEEQDAPAIGGDTGDTGDGGGGGGDVVVDVHLTAQVYGDTSYGGNPSVSIEFGNDGILRVALGGSTAPVDGDWLAIGGVYPSVAAAFEIKASLVGAVDTDSEPRRVAPTGGDSLDTWHGLGTARRFTLDGADPSLAGYHIWVSELAVQIRDVDTHTVQASKTIYLTLYRDAAP